MQWERSPAAASDAFCAAPFAFRAAKSRKRARNRAIDILFPKVDAGSYGLGLPFLPPLGGPLVFGLPYFFPPTYFLPPPLFFFPFPFFFFF
jgi:hypothetical protein